MQTLPWFLLLLPLISAVLIKCVLSRMPDISALVGTGVAALCFVFSLVILAAESTTPAAFSWITTDRLTIEIGLQIDSLSSGMMVIVTTIALLVHIFSLGYMREDPGKSRYFAGLSLFLFSMTGIVLSTNFLMMFVFWELVGVSSYLLIGHWFQKSSAANAANKAFLVNRIGDFGFLIGILLLFGAVGTVDFDALRTASESNGTLGLSGGLFTAAILCLFCGAIGKSAQFPLHVWLPDAMEGPTPVSALIHAATMVAAGVYMLVRIAFLIATPEAADAALTIAWIGGGTALIAALIATQQDDIKKILAYSTVSQLGYMVMAVGFLASDAAMFHLFTHAFFKALLFLGAGAIIHACHHEQNIWKMGGLRHSMPITFTTFLIGTAALCALPYITAGFYSKEYILTAAYSSEHIPLFIIASLVALLTPFYMTRLVVVTFFGKARGKDAEKAREVSPLLWAPLVVLAVPSILFGFKPIAGLILNGYVPDVAVPATVLFVSIATLVVGALTAIALYRQRDSDPLNAPVLRNKFWLDELYLGLVRLFQDSVAYVLNFLDRYLIDAFLVRGTSRVAFASGWFFRRMQAGNLQGYSIVTAIGVLIILYIALS